MPVTSATAPAKTILVGEHAVVYQRPAIAVPVFVAQAKVTIQPLIKAPNGVVHVVAPEIDLDCALTDLPAQHALQVVIRSMLKEMDIPRLPAMRIIIRSDIPTAAGMGSSAAVAVALIRAIAKFLGRALPLEVINRLAYESEKIHHGTPSGIDNTVITYGQPIFFQKSQSPQVIHLSHPITLVIADSGVSASTAEWVGGVRSRWQKDTAAYEAYFDQIAELTLASRQALENGALESLGQYLNRDHHLLAKIGVSIPILDHLVDAARAAGALGSKLTGSGGGGNIIALCTASNQNAVEAALRTAGAVRVLTTEIHPSIAGADEDANLP